MKVVVAPAPFKECLSAAEVAAAMSQGIHLVLPKAQITTVPLSDGGTGFLETVHAAVPVRRVRATACAPRGRRVTVEFAMSSDRSTAYIESARACGLHLVPCRFRNPLRLTSAGLGQIVLAALRRGVGKVVIGLGGTATVDGGAGAVQELGIRFLDRHGSPLTVKGGGDLIRVCGIDASRREPLVANAQFTAVCDVWSRLLGRDGAARRFGPQKGASAKDVALLERGLANLAAVAEDFLHDRFGRAHSEPRAVCPGHAEGSASGEPGAGFLRRRSRLENLKGSGAAGGIGVSLTAFCGARLVPARDFIEDFLGLDRELKGAALVITGEGRIDGTTALGKAPALVASAARRVGVPVVAICGQLGRGWQFFSRLGVSCILPLTEFGISNTRAPAGARRLLRQAGARIAREFIPH